MASKTIAHLNVLLGASNKQLFAALDSSEKRVRRFGQDLERTGKDLSMKVTAPLTALGYVSVNTAATFSDSMLKVQALSGSTGDELSKLEKTALEFGRTTRFSASEVADGMGFMALAGFNTNQILSATPGILALAAASATDLATTSDIVTDTMSAFNMEASKAIDVADLFATAQAKSNTSVTQLGEAFKYVAPNFSAAGQSIQDTTSLLAVLANNGFKGSMAGTALNAMLKDLTGKAKDGALQVGNMSVAIFDSNGNMRSAIDIVSDLERATAGMTQEKKQATLASIFEERALRGVNILLQSGSKELRRYQTELGNASGNAKAMADLMEGGLGGSLRSLKANLEGIAIIIGNNLAPMVQSLSIAIGRLSTFIAGLNPETQRLLTVLGLVAAVIPPLILGFGSMLTMGTALIAKFKLLTGALGLASTGATAFGVSLSAAIWPITAVVAGIYGLVKAYQVLNRNTEINKRVQAEVTQRLKYLNDIKVGAEKITNDLAEAMGNVANMSEAERKAVIENIKARIAQLAVTIEQEKQLAKLTARKAMELTWLEKLKAGMFSFGNAALYSYNLARIGAEKAGTAMEEMNKPINEMGEVMKQLEKYLQDFMNASDSVFSNVNTDLNDTRLISERVKKVFEDLALELKKIAILSDIIGKSYDNIDARVRAFTQAMLDLRVNGVEKTDKAYQDLEDSRNKALDSKQAIELSKKLTELTNRTYEVSVRIKPIGMRPEEFKSGILGMDEATFNQIATKTGEAVFKANMKVAQKQKQANDQILNDKRNFNQSYRMLQESFMVDIAGDLVAGLGGLLVQGRNGFNQFFSSILSNFGRFLVQMGKMGLVYSGFAQKIKGAFLNPAAGISASLAMIAIGGAMTAYAARINSVVGAGTPSGGGSFNAGFFNQRGFETDNEVEFVIRGDRLVGVLGRNSRFRNRF